MGGIKGRVLVYETGGAVANVVVAAFAIAPSDEPNVAHGTALDRLGSAPTNERGEFVIEFSETNARADIVLDVYPPDIAGTDDTEEIKPLYRTRKARSEPGRQAAFVVLLPSRLLRERGLPSFARRDESTPEHVKASVARALTERTTTLGNVREVLRPEFERRAMVRKSAKKQVMRLMGEMPHLGARPDRFVPMGSDATPVVQATRKAGLERLASLKPRGMRVRINKDAFNAHGIELDDQGNLPGPRTLSQDQFAHLVGNYVAAPVRVFDPLLSCKISQSIGNVPNNGDAGEGGSTEPPALGGINSGPVLEGADPTAQVHREILQHVHDAVLSMKSPNGDPSIVRTDPISILKEQLKVELTGGPADGPALHDFHHLQIAWDNVWTAVVDKHLAAKMAALYEAVVEVVDWGSADNPDLSEITELEDFLAMLEESLEVSAGLYGSELAVSNVAEAEERLHQAKSLMAMGEEILQGVSNASPSTLNDVKKKGEDILETGANLGKNVADGVSEGIKSFF